MIIRKMMFNTILLADLADYKALILDLLESVQTLRSFKKEEIIRVILKETKAFLKTIRE
jgi:hypothetical protein